MLSLVITDINSDFLLLLGKIKNISHMFSTALLDLTPISSLASSQTVLSIDTSVICLHFLAGQIFLFQRHRSVEKCSMRKGC